MRWTNQLQLRIRSLFQRQAADSELNDELAFHLQKQTEEFIAQGMDPQEARLAALRSFGGVTQHQEECREARGTRFLENIPQDIRFGLRMLRRSPGFSILTILCLTLGIGANAAVFTWIEGTVLRPYPLVSHQERVMVLGGTERGVSRVVPISWPDFLDLRKNCTLIDSFIAEKITGATLSIGERSETATGSLVSANYFDALGIHPILGRGFTPDEDYGRNAHPEMVISYVEWQTRFQGDPRVIGKTQLLNGVPHTIVGVAPQGFYGTFVGYSWQFWVPASMQETFDSTGYHLEDRGERWIEGFARLKPGVTLDQARQEVAAVAKRLEAEYPATNRGHGVTLLPIWQSPFNATSAVLPILVVTLGAVFFVLLIASANVSNLLLVKAFGRRHEMTVRLAMGAGRSRILQQLLTEGLILSSIAAAGGLLVAYWCRNLLTVVLPARTAPLYVPGNIDWRVLAMSAAVCLIATLVFALVPAIQTSNMDLAGALKSESGTLLGARGRSRLRSGLVLVQVALSFLLLVGAGLVIQSLHALRNADPGFSARGLMVTYLDLFGTSYDRERASNFQDQLLDRVRAISGVQSAAYSRNIPFTYRPYSSAPIKVDGYDAAPDERIEIEYNEVSPGYFATTGIPLVSGRDFTRGDNETAHPVAIVNETMAARYWRGADAIGKRLQVKDRSMTVVGVAKNSKYENLLEANKPFFYVPLRQNPSTFVLINIRSQMEPATVASALGREIQSLDPNLTAYRVLTMRDLMDRMNSSQHVAVTLLGIFGGLALLLAAIGVYGVMSYAVSQSTRDLGLRIALGATAPDLLRLVMSQGFFLTAGGVAAGAAAALGLTRLMGYVLYNVSPRDPLTFAAAFLVMALVCASACLLPALRAAKIDPIRALRE